MFSLIVPDQEDAVALTLAMSSCTQSGVRTDVHVPSSFSAVLDPADVGSSKPMAQPVNGKLGSERFCRGLKEKVSI